MDKENVNQEPAETPDRERDPAEAPAEPRGNPEPDHEDVETGKEQLDKVSGN
jgi:hypothetical protein